MGSPFSTNQPQPAVVNHSNGLTRPKVVVGSGQDHPQQREGESSNHSSEYAKETYSSCVDTVSIRTHPEDTFPWPTIADGHFINTETLRAVPSSNQNGPRVRARNVFPQDEVNRSLSFDQLFKKWKSAIIQRQKNDVLLHILNIRIPYLESGKQFLETAVFLKINDESICKRVKESLMKCLLGCDDELDVSRILEAEVHVWRRFRQHEDHVFDLGLINLLLWCCLLCNTDITEETEERICELSKERRAAIQEFRHEVQSTASGDLFKALQSFHEEFPRRFAKRSVLSWGKDVRNTSNKMDEETLNLVKKAKFCDKLMHIFSLLKQILASGNDCEGILAYLKFILPSLLNGHTEETQTIAVLLTKGCVFALLTAFYQADVQIGPKEVPTKRALVRLIESVLDEQANKKTSIGSIFNIVKIRTNKKSSYNRSQYILEELEPLIFHPAEIVRNQVHKLFSRFRQDFMENLTRREIERGQSNCRLKIASHTNRNGNYFQTFKGNMGSQSVIVYANVPSFDKLNKTSSNNVPHSDKTHSWDKERHINNFNMQRSIPSHINIGWLLGYQVKPFLMYYIVEDSHKTTILEHVLEKRERNNWIEEKDLCTILSDIANGLSALHQHNIILRDLTLSNFFLDRGKVKIGDLSLACKHRAKNNMPVKDPWAQNLAVRWLSPEALKVGNFSPQSDIWSLGHLIYTLWTHGCEPFTEFPDSTTDDIMEKVAFSDVTPFQWSCMQQPIYNLMCRCLKKDPRDRIDLEEFMRELKTYTDQLSDQDVYNDTENVTFQEIKDRDKHYGAPNVHQRNRCNVPEKGIPDFIQEYRQALQESIEYSAPSKKKSVSQQHFLKGPFDLKLTYLDSGVMVKEPMREEFVTKILPQIEATELKPLKKFTHVLHKNGSDSFVEGTAYPESKTLLDMALDGTLSHYGPDFYIHLCYQVAKLLSDIHAKGWILRDLRAKNFLVNQRTYEVYLCRKGGMIQLPYTETGSEFVKEDKDLIREIHRWLPAESVIDGIYSRASDVAAWASLTYEVLQALSERNPKKSVPYYTSSDEELGMLKQNGGFLPKPLLCPDWLNDILRRCWISDRNQRSHLGMVINELEERLEIEIQQHTKRMAASLDNDICPKYERPETSKQNKPLKYLSDIFKQKKNRNKQVYTNNSLNSASYTNLFQGHNNPSFYIEEDIYSAVSYEPVEYQENLNSRKSHKRRHVRRHSSCCSASEQFTRRSIMRRSRQPRIKSASKRKRGPLPATPSEDCRNATISLPCQVKGNMPSKTRDEVWKKIGHEFQGKFCYENGRLGGEMDNGIEAEEQIEGRENGEIGIRLQTGDSIFQVENEETRLESKEEEREEVRLANTNCIDTKLFGDIVDFDQPSGHITSKDRNQIRQRKQRNVENMEMTPLQREKERRRLESEQNNKLLETKFSKGDGGQIQMIADEAYLQNKRDNRTEEWISQVVTTNETTGANKEGKRLDAGSNHWRNGVQFIPVDRPEKTEENRQTMRSIRVPAFQLKTSMEMESQKMMNEKEDELLEIQSPVQMKDANPGQMSKPAESKSRWLHNQKDTQSDRGDTANKMEVQIREPESQTLRKAKYELTDIADIEMIPQQTAERESRVCENQDQGRDSDAGLNNQTRCRKKYASIGKLTNGHDTDSNPGQMVIGCRVLESQEEDMHDDRESDQESQRPENMNTKTRYHSKFRRQITGIEVLREVRNEDEDTELNLGSQKRAKNSHDTVQKLDLLGRANHDRSFESLKENEKEDLRSKRQQKVKHEEKRRDGQIQFESMTTVNRGSHLGHQGLFINDCKRPTKEMVQEIEQSIDVDKNSGPLSSRRRKDSNNGSRMKRKSKISREDDQRTVHGLTKVDTHKGSFEKQCRNFYNEDVPFLRVQTRMAKNSDCNDLKVSDKCNYGNIAIRKSIANESCRNTSLDVESVNPHDLTVIEREDQDTVFIPTSRFRGSLTLSDLTHHAGFIASSEIENVMTKPHSVFLNQQCEKKIDSEERDHNLMF